MRVLLTARREGTRSALKRLLDQESELNVVSTVASAGDLLPQAQETQPDMVVLDWELPGLRASDVLSSLHSLSHSVKVVAFSKTQGARQDAINAGADAFVSREAPPEWLLITMRTVGGLSPRFVA
jgi:DNA-binding NarL/FixJ family response regulator